MYSQPLPWSRYTVYAQGCLDAPFLIAKKASVSIEAKAPQGAQSTNAGAPEGEEQSDSSSSSEEDDDEWSACEVRVTVCHTVSRSRDPGISARLFNLLLLFPLQLVFAQKKISNSSNIQSSDSIWGNQRSCGNYTGIGFWCLKVP